MKLAIALLITISAFAKKAPDTPAIPSVPPEIQAEYYRSEWEVSKLQPAWDTATNDRTKITQILIGICGIEYYPVNEDKHISCKLKPKPPAPAKPETK